MRLVFIFSVTAMTPLRTISGTTGSMPRGVRFILRLPAISFASSVFLGRIVDKPTPVSRANDGGHRPIAITQIGYYNAQNGYKAALPKRAGRRLVFQGAIERARPVDRPAGSFVPHI